MKTIRKFIIPVLLTILMAIQFVCLVKGIIFLNWLGVCGYLNSIIGIGFITAFSWGVGLGFVKIRRVDLQPTKETKKYRRRKNGKED